MNKWIFIITYLTCLQVCAQIDKVQTVVQTGHYEPVTAIAFTTDGNYLLSASRDLTVKLWEIETQRELRTFTGPEYYVKRIGIDPKGGRMLTISMDKKVWFWNLKTGAMLKILEDSVDIITNAIFTPDGKYIITGGEKLTGAVWDATTYDLVARLNGAGLGCGRGQCYVDLQTTKDGKWLIAGVQNYQVEYWNMRSFSLDKTLKIKWGSCSSCTSKVITDSRNNSLITTTGDSLHFRELKSGDLLPVSTYIEDVDEMRFSNDGNYIGVMERGFLGILSARGDSIYTLGNYPDGVSAFAFDPQSKKLATATSDYKIIIRHIASGKEEKTLLGYLNNRTDSLKKSVRYWAKNLKKQELSPDGTLVLQNMAGAAVLWELNTGRVIRKFEVNDWTIIASRFSPDGQQIATAGGDRQIRLWDTQNGKLLKTFSGQSGTIFSLDFSPDGKFLVSGGWDQSIIVWDISSGEIYSRFQPHTEGSPVEVRFTPTGLYVVSGGLDKKLLLTDIDTGLGVREFIGHRSHVVSIDFSSDGKYMLTGSWDSNAKLWDVSTGLALARFASHTGAVYDVDISPSGKWFATGSLDKTAKIWEQSGKLIFDFAVGMGAVTSVNFTPDEKYLITKSRDGTTKVWDLKTGNEVYSHIITSENEWVIKSTGGDFYATDNAREEVHFVNGMKSYDLEQFFDKFYNPNVIEESKVSAGKSNDRLINSLIESPPPEVEIISPKGFLSTTNKKLEIVYKITNTGGGIDEVKITHNGKALKTDSIDKKLKKKSRALYLTTSVNLVPGHNKFDISAFSQNRIESRKKSFEVIMEGVQEKPTCYILAIGINKYQNPQLNLNYAKSDASGFVKAIRKKGKSLFKEIKLTTLYDYDASRDNILQGIEDIASNAEPQDVFYMYYAGHGSVVDDQFYFIPSEVVRLYESDILKNTAISANEMQSKLKHIKALKQMIIMDACHSGSSTEILASRGGGEEKALAQLSRSAGIHVLAAAGSEQTATEFEVLGHGLFTYLLLEALDGAADGAPLDGKVTVYELRAYIDNLVPEYSLKYKGAPQYPNTFSRGSDFPLIIHSK